MSGWIQTTMQQNTISYFGWDIFGKKVENFTKKLMYDQIQNQPGGACTTLT
jgi:hypothetical protein